MCAWFTFSHMPTETDDCGLAIGDMAAASERGDDYLRSSSQFCKRLLDFLPVVFQSQVRLVALFVPRII